MLLPCLFGKKLHDITDGFDAGGIVIGDGDVEFFTEAIDEEELIHRIGLQVFNKAGFRRDVGAVNFQNIANNTFYSRRF